MMRLLFAIPLILLGCTPIPQSSVNSDNNPKVLTLKDLTYESQIRSASIHPTSNEPESTLLAATTPFGNWSLMLEFDDLVGEKDNYYVKIIHCNFDWTKSNLQDLDFMTQYNEFNINNFEYSTDTHIPYIHYWFQLPPVKLPGNYVAMVYRNGDKDDLVLTKRFMVYDKQVYFSSERNLIGAGGVAQRNQQINFTVNYKDLDIINPMQTVKVVIRQNQRWDNMAVDIKPSFIREIEKQLEYRFFDDIKMFKGGNEFRFFDMRSLNYPGRNVASVNKTVKPYEVYLGIDKSRMDEVYSQYVDQNGGFVIENLDFRGASFANYAYVNFTLQTKIPPTADVYVTGGFTNWQYNEENKMLYDSADQRYHGRVLLKQGWYDYQYVVNDHNLPYYYLEGSHFETENDYEIFVYYQPFQPRADILVGYLKLTKNQR